MKLLSSILIGFLLTGYYAFNIVHATEVSSEIKKMVSPVLYNTQFRGYKEYITKVAKELSSSGIIEGEFFQYNPKAKIPSEVFLNMGGSPFGNGGKAGTLPHYFFWMNKALFDDWMVNHSNQNYFVYVNKPVFQDGNTVMTMDDAKKYIPTKCFIEGKCSANLPNVKKGVTKFTVDIYVNATWTNGAKIIEKNQEVAWNYYLQNKANKKQVSGVSAVKVYSKDGKDSLVLWKRTLTFTVQR